MKIIHVEWIGDESCAANPQRAYGLAGALSYCSPHDPSNSINQLTPTR
jgi:hypothetical protein